MLPRNVVQYGVFVLIVALLVKPTGVYLERVFSGKRTMLDPVLRRVEQAIYRIAGIRIDAEMDALTYALAVILFGFVGTLLLYLLLRIQRIWPVGPNASTLATPMSPDLALNTSISFSTATTWQAYAGETTMKYVSQAIGLAAQNVLAGATGLAIGIAFIRGFARRKTPTLGNFWVDVTRAVLWVMLPLALVGSVLLVWQGVPMNFSPYTHATSLEGAAQIIPQGPVAGLTFVESLGTNGGGFFNANNAHPYQNPTGLSNLLEMLAVTVVPAALTYTFGRMVGRQRAGWVLFAVMLVLFIAGVAVCDWAERRGNPAVAAMHAIGGNMEGKEVRLGIGGSVLAAAVTSNGATGAYNAMHDSFMPLGVLIPLSNMLLGEMIFGGLGTGLYSIIMVALVGLFLAGLMIGRTPEYLGKKIGPTELKLVMLYTLAYPIVIVFLTALAVRTHAGLAGLTTNAGTHGYIEILYAYTSSAANNGQSMAGLSANSAFYNLTTALAMLVGRFFLAIPALLLAGRLAMQGRRTTTPGTLPSDTATVGAVTIGAAILIGALCFFPFLALGPILEHFSLLRP